MKFSSKLLHLALAAALCTTFSGCWFLVIGGAGAVAGYAVSRDTFEGVSSRGQEEIMSAAHKVLAIMGTITGEHPREGQINAIVYGNHVTVSVIQVNLTTSKIRVKARNGIFPRIGVAQDVYTKIINQLEK
ncbi:MAG: hypothetical protein KGK03_10545 [Candidatus Omnitrophica bacterium]|nr:hypothetical protein [Candidatus Omnitrophota bacterium]MDE2223493.1 hypothetical protein [Candidatus Omnitrophota bacterium]